MDEVARRQAGRMDSPRFEDRHPVLNPEHGFGGIDLGEKKTGPAAIARGCEQFAESRPGKFGQAPPATRFL